VAGEASAMRLSSQVWARAMCICMALAVWPVWRWYVLRMTDGGDEPCGLLALAPLAATAVRNGLRFPEQEKQFIAPAMLLAIYTVMFNTLSPLPRALLVMAAFALLFFRRETLVGNAGLLVLSLPVIATVQFYLGYPLRVLAAEASVLTLRALQFGVTREGSLLHWRGESILVDAPCSGVRMLWFGLYLAAAIASWTKLSNTRSAVLFAIALVLVITANVVRAALLFFKEARIVALPEWTHAAVGVVVFGCAALAIARLAQGREARTCAA